MDIRQISYFVEIAHQRSFTKAAQKISISQPALSKCIQNLEEELGLELFLREHGNITLTKGGEAILEDAEELLLHFHTVQHKFSSVRQQGRLFLSVGCAPLLSSMFGERLIAGFLKDQEQVSFAYSEAPVEQLIGQVFRMDTDLALCMLCRDTYRDMDKVRADTIHFGTFLAAAAPDKAADREYLEELDLSRERLVTSWELSSRPGGLPLEKFRSVYYADRISALRNKVTQEGYIAIVPDLARQYFPDNTEFLKLKDPVKYEVSFVSKHNMGSTKLIKSLKNYVTMNYINRP